MVFECELCYKEQPVQTMTGSRLSVGRSGVDLLLAVLGNYSDSSLIQQLLNGCTC